MHDVRLAFRLARVWTLFAVRDWRNFMFSVLGSVAQVMIFGILWSTLGEPSLAALTALSIVHAWIAAATISRWLQRRIYHGDAAYDFVRPQGIFRVYTATQVGFAVPFLAVGLVLIAAVAWWYGLSVNLPRLACYIAASILGLVVAGQIGIIFGVTAFWLRQIQGINTIFRLIAQFFGGAVVPLSVMPMWLAWTASILPFRATAAIPASMLVSPRDQLSGLTVQATWVVLLGAICFIVTSAARRRGSELGG